MKNPCGDGSNWFKTYSYHISYFTYLQSTTSAIAIARSWPESPVCFLRPTALQLLWRITSSTSISFMVLPSYRVGLQHSLYIYIYILCLSFSIHNNTVYCVLHIYIYIIYVCVCAQSTLRYIHDKNRRWFMDVLSYDLTNKMISKAPVGYCALGAKRNDRASIRRCRSFNMVQHVYIHTRSIACT